MNRRQLISSMGALGALLPSIALAQAEEKPVREKEQQKHEYNYALPDLPYPADALEPVLDKATVTIHHDKHHAGYVKGLNAAFTRLEKAGQGGDYSMIKSICRDIAFNGSGVILHNLYWENLAPGGAAPDPTGVFMNAVKSDFGSFEKMLATLLAATKAVEGSGWGLLTMEPYEGRLVVFQAEKHQNLAVWGALPLMVIDVWEHAYYLKYKNDRGAYVNALSGILNWKAAEFRYNKWRSVLD